MITFFFVCLVLPKILNKSDNTRGDTNENKINEHVKRSVPVLKKYIEGNSKICGFSVRFRLKIQKIE